jgi:hypothetical protein
VPVLQQSTPQHSLTPPGQSLLPLSKLKRASLEEKGKPSRPAKVETDAGNYAIKLREKLQSRGPDEPLAQTTFG